MEQVLLFFTVNVANRRFKYFFLMLNVIPLILYFFFSFPAENLIVYFLLEALVYCFMNIIYIKLFDLPVGLIKILLILFCLTLITLSTYLIPLWNKDEANESRIAFWNYLAILFSFYTVNFFTVGDKFYDWEENTLKRNVIFKFGVLLVVAVLGFTLGKYIKSDLAFIVAMISVKTTTELLTLRRTRTV